MERRWAVCWDRWGQWLAWCLKGPQSLGAAEPWPILISALLLLSAMSRFPVLLQFHTEAKCATHHRHSL